jgi:hypothetical protein
MVTHVSFARLDRVFCDGKYSSPKLNPDDFAAIQRLVWEAMGRPSVENIEVVEEIVEELTVKEVVIES